MPDKLVKIINQTRQAFTQKLASILLEVMVYMVLASIVYATYLYVGDLFFGTDLSKSFGIHHILTLLIFAEVMAMMTKYIEDHIIPVEFMGYLAITAIARHLLVDMGQMDTIDTLFYSISIFILIIAVSVYKYCNFAKIADKFKNNSDENI